MAPSPADRPSTGSPAAMRWAFVALATLPWLWPFTSGPSANVLPLLAAWTCVAIGVMVLALHPSPGEVLRTSLPAAWLAAALLSALVGLSQWFGVAPHWSWISPAEIGQAYGNLRQRNQFASLMALGLAAAIWAGPGSGRRWRVPAVLLLATASAASASRTGLLELLGLTLVAGLWPGPRRDRLVLGLCALGAYAAASVLLPVLLFQWRGVEAPNALIRAVTDLGCSSRRVLWDNVLHLIALRPWTGWGVGELSYAHYITLYPGARFCDILDNAHNLPLHVAVELGVPAALVGSGLVIAAVWRLQPQRQHDPMRQLAWAGVAVMALHSMLEYPLWYGPFQIALLQCVATVVPWRRGAWSVRVRRAALAFGVAVVATLGWVWCRYDLMTDAYRAPEDRRAFTRSDPVAVLRSVPPFSAQLRFAELSLTHLTAANAAEVHALALDMLHYSPEPLVIGKLVDSAMLLHREDEAAFHLRRFKAAFPEQYAAWARERGVDAPARGASIPGGKP